MILSAPAELHVQVLNNNQVFRPQPTGEDEGRRRRFEERVRRGQGKIACCLGGKTEFIASPRIGAATLGLKYPGCCSGIAKLVWEEFVAGEVWKEFIAALQNAGRDWQIPGPTPLVRPVRLPWLAVLIAPRQFPTAPTEVITDVLATFTTAAQAMHKYHLNCVRWN